MHIQYNPDTENWGLLLDNVVQYGGSGYSFFKGMPMQRGAGIGSIIQNIFRFLAPYGRELGHTLGQEGIKTGSRILNSMVAGDNLKQSLKREGRQGLKNILNNTADRIGQEGSGAKNRSTLYARRKRALPAKRVKKDALGAY